MSAECGIDCCGVQAIGRCLLCSRAFCGSHQGRVGRYQWATTLLVDRCSACTQERASQASQSAEDTEAALARRRIAASARLAEIARTLVDAGILPATRRCRIGSRRRFLRGYVDDYVEVAPPAWPIGLFEWYCEFKEESHYSKSKETGISTEGDVVRMDESEGDREVWSFGGQPERFLEAFEEFAHAHDVSLETWEPPPLPPPTPLW